MKEPIEYLGNVNSLTTREELYNIGKQMQLDAYNEAIRYAAEEADWECTSDCVIVRGDIFIDKESILKLLKS